MDYHPLFNDTGQTPEERRNEADRILKMLDGHEGEMEDREAEFIEDMGNCQGCTPKQIFWLRDIKDKYDL